MRLLLSALAILVSGAPAFLGAIYDDHARCAPVLETLSERDGEDGAPFAEEIPSEDNFESPVWIGLAEPASPTLVVSFAKELAFEDAQALRLREPTGGVFRPPRLFVSHA